MSSLADALLQAAREHLGYREEAGGYTKFGDWYYTNVDSSTSAFKTAPWCDMFVTWAGHQAGIAEYVGEFAHTVSHARWFQEQGAWSDTPEPGAVVFFDWAGTGRVGGIDHVGIVERVEGRTIHTIEGNADRVWLKRKARDKSKVVGYGLPRKVQERKAQEQAQQAQEQDQAQQAQAQVQQSAAPGAASGGTAQRVDLTAGGGAAVSLQAYTRPQAVPATSAGVLPEATVPALTLVLLVLMLLFARRTGRRPALAGAASDRGVPGRGRHRRPAARGRGRTGRRPGVHRAAANRAPGRRS